MKRAALLLLLAVSSSAGAYRPAFCTPDSKHEESYCRCLIYHPKEEFCESPTAPLPSCCRATEHGRIKACGCCASVYGSKRISADERGSYVHVIEYAR